jgi:hypothetical protein
MALVERSGERIEGGCRDLLEFVGGQDARAQRANGSFSFVGRL